MVLRDLEQEAVRNVACALGARLVGYPEGLDNHCIGGGRTDGRTDRRTSDREQEGNLSHEGLLSSYLPTATLVMLCQAGI